jgi:hypothetical protein
VFHWYKIFDLAEFIATGLVSRKITAFFEAIGQKDILVTVGNEVGILYEGTFLVLNFNGQNPYTREGLAVYVDDDDMVWLGIEVEEE